LPEHVKFSFHAQDFFSPIKIDTNNYMVSKAKDIQKDIHGSHPFHNYS
jgi:hypothetical protein